MKDLIDGKIDVAIIWGPVAGYCAKKYIGWGLQLVPIQEENPHWPMSYAISMGVKRGRKALKTQLEQMLDLKTRNDAKDLVHWRGSAGACAGRAW